MEETLELQEIKICQSTSDNDLFNYIIDKRNLNEIDFQKDVCCNPLYKNSTIPVAFLQSECSGKTEEMLALLEMFYFRDINKNKKTILNPSALKVTRDNVEDRFIDFKPEFFKFKVAKNSTEYFDLLNKPEQWDVLIITPQLLNSKNEENGIYNYELLPEIEIYICDEGSDWYFEKVVQRMLKHIEPNIQWIFAAQSGKFNLHKDRFIRVFTSTSTLYDKGIINNVKFNVVTTNVDLKASDFASTKNIGYGNLKEELTNDKKTNIRSFREILSEMVKVLKIENSEIITPNSNFNRLTNNYAHIFGFLEQTMIVCNSKPQANDFYDELNNDKNLKGKILISTEDTDTDSIQLKEFKKGNHRILIVVYKGRKGYSHNELFNIVDFTYTQDPEMIKNISGRVYRKSKLKPNKQKTYFKVAYKTAAPWYVTIMTGVLALMEDGPYQTYNTKNFDGFKIPVVVTTQETNKKSKGKGKKRKPNPDFVPVSKMGLPLDMNFFNNVAHHKLNDAYSVIAYTTIGELRRNHFEMSERWSPEKVEEVYSMYKNKTLRELTTNHPLAYQGAFRYGSHVELMEKYNIIYLHQRGEKDYSVLLTCKNNEEAKEKYNAELVSIWKSKDKKLIEKYTGHFEKLRVKGYTDKMLLEFFNSLPSDKYPNDQKDNKEFNGKYRAIFNRGKDKWYKKILNKWGNKVPMLFLKDEDKLKKVKREIKMCKNYSEWFNNYKSSHNNILTKLNRFDLVDKLPREVNKKHTKENIAKMLKKYKGKFPNEFRKDHNAEWSWVRKNKLEKELYKDLKHDPRRKQKI